MGSVPIQRITSTVGPGTIYLIPIILCAATYLGTGTFCELPPVGTSLQRQLQRPQRLQARSMTVVKCVYREHRRARNGEAGTLRPARSVAGSLL